MEAETHPFQPRTWARRAPDRLAFRVCASGESVSFAELEARANQGAHLLRARGIGVGDHIAILMENRREFLEICFAADRAGVYYTTVSTHLTGDEIAYILADCGARLLIVSESRASDMSARVDVYGQVVKKGCLVLAYEDVATARAMREFLSSRNDAPCMRYLPMRCSVDAWLLYLQALLSREWIIPEELVNGSVPRPEQPVSQSGKGAVVPRLTSREREVLKRVSEGLRNKSIAHDLGLSEHTVKLHLHNVFAKIGVDNRAHATAWYMARMGSAQDDGQGRN